MGASQESVGAAVVSIGLRVVLLLPAEESIVHSDESFLPDGESLGHSVASQHHGGESAHLNVALAQLCGRPH